MASRSCRLVLLLIAVVVVLQILYPAIRFSPKGPASTHGGFPGGCANIRADHAQPKITPDAGKEIQKHCSEETVVALAGCVPFAGPLLCGARACVKRDWPGVCMQIGSLAFDIFSGLTFRRAKMTAGQASMFDDTAENTFDLSKKTKFRIQAAEVAKEAEMVGNAFNIFLCADVAAKFALVKEARDHDSLQ